jgi:hypothetical protein
VLRWGQLVAALGILALALRTAQILSSDPIRDVDTELLYLRLGDLRRAGLLLLTALLLEVYEFFYPQLTRSGMIRRLPAWSDAMNGFQGLLLLGAATLVFLRFREYTAGGQRRHMESTLGELAEQRGPRAPAQEVEEPETEEEE